MLFYFEKYTKVSTNKFEKEGASFTESWSRKHPKRGCRIKSLEI